MLSALLHLRGSVIGAGLAVLLPACSSPTAPTSVQGILAHEATWAGQGLTSYSYTYRVVGFADLLFRLEVRQDTVRSAVVLATGESIPPGDFPTISALFDQALGAARNGSLTDATFDGARGYPTLLTYATVPDKVSLQQATDLQPLQ